MVKFDNIRIKESTKYACQQNIDFNRSIKMTKWGTSEVAFLVTLRS